MPSEAGRPAGGGGRRILHISADYPDPIGPAKTQVIRTLRDLVADRFDQDVLSLNRSFAFSHDVVIEEVAFAHGTALRYAAPPHGLFHRNRLEALADRLTPRLTGQGLPDLIVGHKLTVEGIVAARCAARLGVPYAVTIQGNTDTRIAAARPDLRALYATILNNAAAVFCFSPWAWARLRALLPGVAAEPVMLPCPTPLDTPLVPRAGDGRLISAFHLRNHAEKNLAGLARAAATMSDGPPVTILGGGSADDIAACRRILRRAPVIELAGEVPHVDIAARLNRASGFVMPSLRESFGLVFVEALFAGLPIVYPRGAGVDGWFDGLPFAVPVDAREPRSIAAGMRRLVDEEGAMKAALADWQASEAAQAFTRPAIARRFAEGLARAARRD